MKTTQLHRLLIASSAVSALAGHAHAQTQVGASTEDTSPQNSGLEDIVVTAMRQSESVNRVPLSITAVTQKSIGGQVTYRF